MLLMTRFVRSLGSFQASLKVTGVCSGHDHRGSVVFVSDRLTLAFRNVD